MVNTVECEDAGERKREKKRQQSKSRASSAGGGQRSEGQVMKNISTCSDWLSGCTCTGLPGGRGGGDGAPSQGHLVDVVVSGAVQVGQGEVGAGSRSHRS